MKVKLQEMLWQRELQKKYYHHTLFKECDVTLLSRYARCTPYEISKRFMQAQGASQIHVYGETPLKLYDQMARLWGLQPQHLFVELGCGRGRGLLFLAHFYHCTCYGIEWIEEFVHKAQGLHTHVHLYCEDFMTSSRLDGDFLYLYGTCLEDEDIMKLCQRLLCVRPGCKMITVSFSLCEYHHGFRCIDRFKGVFPWGQGTIFLNIRREESCPKLL